MASERDLRRKAYVEKTTVELTGLAKRGVVMGGNAFSPILFAKGELTEEEAAGSAEPFSGDDGIALRASLSALCYQPQDWETLLVCDASGEKPLEPALLREALCALDPATLVCCDEASADAVRESYADDLAELADLDQALLAPGVVAHACGMRVLNLGGFAAALGDVRQKQLMWARLKQLPPLGEPY